jgi:hypothetical protein
VNYELIIRIFCLSDREKGGSMKLLIVCMLFISLAVSQTVLWERSYDAGGPGDIARGVAVDYEQNIVVTGYKGSGTGNDSVITLKYSPTGSLIWARRFGAGTLSQGTGVAVDNNNNVIVSGYRQDSGTSAFLLIKYDKNGTFLWSREYIHGYWDGACGVATDNNDNIIATGWYTTGSYWEPLTVKYDFSGNFIWARTFSTGYQSYTLRTETDDTDNIYVAGFFYPVGTGNCGFLTIKYNQAGTYLWDRTYTRFFPGGPEPWDGAYGLTVDKANNPIVTGTLLNANYDCVTIKYNPSGTQLWDETYDSGDNNGGGGVTADQLNNVIVVAANSATDLLKYDPSGTLTWQDSHTASISMDVATDNLNNFYAVGDNGSDMFIVKYGIEPAIQEDVNSSLTSHDLMIMPNPSHGMASISFSLDKTSSVALKIYDRTGREVAVITEGILNKGNYSFRWNAKDAKNHILPNGVYYVLLKSEHRIIGNKLLLIRFTDIK